MSSIGPNQASKRRSGPAYVIAAVVVAIVGGLLISTFTGFGLPFLWRPSSQPPPEDELEFSQVDLDSGGNASWLVGAVRGGPYPYGGLSVRLTVNGTSMTWVPLGRNDSNHVIVVGSVSYRVVWSDEDANGSVSPGDRFVVTGDRTPLPSRTDFEFGLKWMELWISKAFWSTG